MIILTLLLIILNLLVYLRGQRQIAEIHFNIIKKHANELMRWETNNDPVTTKKAIKIYTESIVRFVDSYKEKKMYIESILRFVDSNKEKE